MGKAEGHPDTVFPTRVGVNRASGLTVGILSCFPHTRGGEPLRVELKEAGKGFSPHAWG